MPAELQVYWIIGSLVIVGLYALLLLFFFFVLIRRKKVGSNKEPLRISVVIPFKNEGGVLLRRIENAKVLQENIHVREVIFINDHSSDLTQSQINEYFENTNLNLIHLPANKTGKKVAIHFGATRATGEWILTSDADTWIDIKLFKALARKVTPEISCIVLPVRPVGEKRIVRYLFDLEFMALQAVGLASAKMHMPLLANGAALFFRKEKYLDAATQRTDWKISGGDDLFTIFSIARKFGRRSVTTLISEMPFAEAEFPQTIKLLWHQRLRWIQKVPGIGGLWFTGVAWLVFIANVTFVAAWIVSGYTETYSVAVYITMLKTLPELFILGWAVLYFQRLETAWWIIPAMLVYPFYLTTLILSGMYIKPAWK